MKSLGKLFLQRNWQVIYAVVLILLIPLTIVFNTVSAVNAFRRNIDVELQRQALLTGQVFNALVKDTDFSSQALQEKVLAVGQATEEIRTFQVLLPDGEDFVIAASLNEANIGQKVSDLNNYIAWHENQAIAILAYGRVGEFIDEDQRFWEVAMPLTDADGQKKALLSLHLSLATMDDLVSRTLAKSYFILAATVLIVILLLIANTRLFEYAVLFKKLKEVDQMKDEFISMSSHELRTPITTIRGFLSMILEGDYGQLTEPGKKTLKIMEASVNRLANLVEDLLNVSRIEQKRLELTLAEVNVGEILTSVKDEFTLQAQNKNLELKLSIPENLPLVTADKDKLRQVLINLVGNSIKYTKQGSIELSAKETDNKFASISIKDTGIGISAPDREKLFSKFYRVKTDETQGIVGTGLGLWITKQLVELMGGNIYVDSIEHVGTQVYFTLPISKK